MGFEANVAQSILSAQYKIDPPEGYQANAHFKGALYSTFASGTYGRQDKQYGTLEWLRLQQEGTQVAGKLGNNYLRSVKDEKDPVARMQALVPQQMYQLQ